MLDCLRSSPTSCAMQNLDAEKSYDPISVYQNTKLCVALGWHGSHLVLTGVQCAGTTFCSPMSSTAACLVLELCRMHCIQVNTVCEYGIPQWCAQPAPCHHPGFVHTSLMQEAHWSLYYPLKLLSYVSSNRRSP